MRQGDRRLSRKKWEPVLFSPKNDVVVSIVSLWEMAVKRGLGRLDFEGSVSQFSQSMQDDLGFRLLSLEVTHLERLESLPHHHRDPFDRLLIAQAIELGAVAVTNDTAWRPYEVKTKW